jgi:rhomboid family GlyGly-CTERM serine protease
LSARWAWPGLCLLLGLGALALQLGAGDGAVWALDRSKTLGEPWRLLSAALWHWNAWHLAGNLAGLALLALLGWRAGFGMRPALAWLLAWPLTQALLLLQPRLPLYAGLSGVLHAGVLLAALALWRQWLGKALLAGLVAKLLLEQPWGPLLRPNDWWGGATLAAGAPGRRPGRHPGRIAGGFAAAARRARAAREARARPQALTGSARSTARSPRRVTR